jgi:hypothetical protein
MLTPTLTLIAASLASITSSGVIPLVVAVNPVSPPNPLDPLAPLVPADPATAGTAETPLVAGDPTEPFAALLRFTDSGREIGLGAEGSNSVPVLRPGMRRGKSGSYSETDPLVDGAAGKTMAVGGAG